MMETSSLQDLWTRWLACPRCTGTFRVVTSGSEQHLECTLCASRFPVYDGIPSFVEGVTSAQANEIAVRDKEAGSYEGIFLAWENFLEMVPLVADLEPKSTDVILDVGAGTGRFLREYIREVRTVVAVDHSLESLRHLRRSVGLVAPAQGKLIPVQGDACALPVRKGVFDSVVSVGMLQHLPTENHRRDAINGMGKSLRKGGRFVLEARHWSRTHEFLAKRKDSRFARRVAEFLIGNADGGIERPRVAHHAEGSVMIYNITAEELYELVTNAGVNVERVVGRLTCAKGMNRLSVYRPALERLLELSALSLVAAQEIVAVGNAMGS